MKEAGYSNTPLARKLGIKEGQRCAFINTPEHYFKLFADLPKMERVEQPDQATVDFVHAFYKLKANFEIESVKLKELLKPVGMLWISWPKKSSDIKTDLSREYVREYLLRNGLVDVKVCAVDMDWSGLKFVYRLKDRKQTINNNNN